LSSLINRNLTSPIEQKSANFFLLPLFENSPIEQKSANFFLLPLFENQDPKFSGFSIYFIILSFLSFINKIWYIYSQYVTIINDVNRFLVSV